MRLKAKLFRGLGDRSRLAILEAILDGPRNVGQIVAETGLSQPNASMHLECLYCCAACQGDSHPEGRNLLFVDGSVKWVTKKEFEKSYRKYFAPQ